MPDSHQPDWLSMQYDSFQRFFSKEDPPPEISLQSIIAEFSKNSLFKIIDWEITDPPVVPNDYIAMNHTFIRELRFITDFKEESEFGNPSIDIPSPTPDGEFILHSNGLKANRYVMIMDMNRSPGIHYKIQETHAATIRTLIIKPLIRKQYIYNIKKNKKNGKEDFRESKSRPYHENFSAIGKKQISHILKNNKSINTTIPTLIQGQIELIINLFENYKLDAIDERSWLNLKVNLIGDYLYKYIYKYFSEIKQVSDYDAYIRSIQSLRNSINSLFYFSNNLQLIDSTNPLSEISQKRRLTLSNHPGFPSEGQLLEKRDVHPTDFGRVCSIESPQGKMLGFNLYLAKDARISSLGTIETPFKNIDNGEEINLDPFDESEKVKAICTAGQANDKQGTFIKGPNGEVTLLCKNDSITHETITNHSFLGYAASLIPFIQHNDGGRALMGANMMKQAVLLRNPEPPLVKTGFEAVIAKKYDDQSKNPFIKNNQLCLGRNFLVGYLPWDLLNFEDGIVISDRLVRNDFLTHIETEDIFFDQKHDEKIDINNIVTVGSKVKPGKRLIKKYRVLSESERKKLKSGDKRKTEDCSLYAPSDLMGVVTDVQFLSQRPMSDQTLRIKVEKAFPIKVGDKLTGRHGNKGIVSAILPEREMPYFLTENNGCSDQQCSITKPHTHLEVMLNPLGITGRMNVGQLYETALGWIAKHTAESKGIIVEPFSVEWSWERIKTVMGENNLSPKQKLFFYKDGAENEICADPLSGQITVGYQYMMKLSHLAEKKITSRSQKDREYDLAMGQPIIPKSPPTDMVTIWENKKSRKRKGQRLGEMEVWALLGHSAWNIIDEFLFLKSDAETDRSYFLRYIKGIEREIGGLSNPQRGHRALKALIHYFRGLGLEAEAMDKGSNLIEMVGPSSSVFWPKIMSLTIRIATDKEREDWAQGKEVKNPGKEKNGLWSKDIFGDENDLDDKKLKNAYGIIRLPIPIDNPIFSGLFVDVLKILGWTITGPLDLYDFIKNIDWKDIIDKAGKRSKLIKLINQIIQHSYTQDDFFIENLLVLPKSLRVETGDLFSGNNPKYRNDLNCLYQEIIKKIQQENWNDRASKYFAFNVKMLRILVHALLVNGKMSSITNGLPLDKKDLNDPYNSLLATVAGYRISKNSIIRKHLLGKRADFSGRAVIIPDPDLGLNEAGIPYEMAKTIFQPMIIQQYLKAHPEYTNPSDPDVILAVKYIENKDNKVEVRSWLNNILSQNFIILNRAPSLHRLNMLSFRPCLYDIGDVIRINPYVCKAYNADFDGDAMSLHVPMLPDSKAEAERMLPSKCLKSPANGELLISHKADIGLGWYFLKKDDTPGWNKLKSVMGINATDSNELQKYLEELYINFNSGFEDSLKSFTAKIRQVLNRRGITIGLDDFSVTEEMRAEIKKVRDTIDEGVWSSSVEAQSNQIHNELDKIANKFRSGKSDEYLLETSNLRDLIKSKSVRIDLMQLVGMRAYQSRPGGAEVACPILSNISEGLSPLEYFNSCHGSRYGLADKGQSTAVAGELTNILVQAVQDVFVTEEDCGTENGLYFSDFVDAIAGKIPLKDRIINRCLAEDITIDKKVIEKGTIIDDVKMAELISNQYNWIKIRSPIFCKCDKGICQKCYGHDLSTGKSPTKDYPAGIIAAQSIGEPGTQLALRTFHGGGAAGSGIGVGINAAKKLFSGTYTEVIPNQNIPAAPNTPTPNKMSWFVIIDPDTDKLLKQYPVLKDPKRPAAKYIRKEYGKAAAAEYLLFALQRVYNSNSKISDHHFEVIISKMLLKDEIRGITTVGNQDPGVLAKLSFRSLPKVLMEAAIFKATDELNGLKERIIAGKRIAPQ